MAAASECGDGIHEPGELCYVRIETGLSHVEAYGASIARDGTMEDALVVLSLSDVGKDATLELSQVIDGELVSVTQPLMVVDGSDLHSFASVDLEGDRVPEIVARSITAFTIVSLTEDSLLQTGPLESHPQAPYAGGPFLPGDVDGDGRDEVFFYTGRLSRLSDAGLETFAEVPLGGCGTLRAGQVADFDEDGREDFVAVGTLDDAGIDCASTEQYDPIQHRATIVLGTPDPRNLEVSAELQPQVVPLDVVTGDYDGDGHADIAFGGPDGVRVFLGRGDGSFADPIALRANNALDGQLRLRHAADVDADGEDELAVVIASDNSFGLVDDVTGDSVVQELMPSEYELSSAAADFNNDGVIDFALFRGRTVGLSLLVSNP